MTATYRLTVAGLADVWAVSEDDVMDALEANYVEVEDGVPRFQTRAQYDAVASLCRGSA